MDLSVSYVGPDGMSLQLLNEIKQKYGSRAQNKGFVTGYMASARAGETGGHFADRHGITHAVDIGVDIESDGSGLLPADALKLAEHLRSLGASGKHPFSRRGYLIHDLSTTTTPAPRIAGFHTGWKWVVYTGASPHSDHIHVTTGGDQQWGGPPQLLPASYNSRQSWGVANISSGGGNDVSGSMRPVPEMYQVSQGFWGTFSTRFSGGTAHGAMDIACPPGTPILAPDDGVIVFADWAWNLPGGPNDWVSRWYQLKPTPGDTRTGGGIMTVIRNDLGSHWIMAHLSSNNEALEGKRVSKGDVIGKSGNTGSSTGPHLHLGLIPPNPNWGNGQYGAIDPAPFLTESYAPTRYVSWTGSATVGKGSSTNTKFDFLEWLAMASQTEINKALNAWANSKEGKAAIGTAVLDRKFKDSQDRSISLAYVLQYDKSNWDLVRAIANAVRPSTLVAGILGHKKKSLNGDRDVYQILTDIRKNTEKGA